MGKTGLGDDVDPNDIQPQGSGSGLDADTVDGSHASAISGTKAPGYVKEAIVSSNTNVGTDGGLLDGGDAVRWVEVPASADYATQWIGACLPGIYQQDFEIDAVIESAANSYSGGLIGVGDGTAGTGNDILFYSPPLNSTTEKVRTNDGTSSTTTNLTRDWTVSHTFRAEWTSSQVDFYEDGTLLASHSTNLPTISCMPTAEAKTNSSNAPASGTRTTVTDVRLL